jgi:hypothetical protein
MMNSEGGERFVQLTELRRLLDSTKDVDKLASIRESIANLQAREVPTALGRPMSARPMSARRRRPDLGIIPEARPHTPGLQTNPLTRGHRSTRRPSVERIVTEGAAHMQMLEEEAAEVKHALDPSKVVDLPLETSMNTITATSFDSRFPAGGIVKPGREFFWSSTGILPQAIYMTLQRTAQLAQVLIVCSGVRRLSLSWCTAHRSFSEDFEEKATLLATEDEGVPVSHIFDLKVRLERERERERVCMLCSPPLSLRIVSPFTDCKCVL